MEEEEVPVCIDMDIPISVVVDQRKKLITKRKRQPEKKAASDEGAKGLTAPKDKNSNGSEFPPEVTVSAFDYSVENHFTAVDTISRLCGESDSQDFDPAEIRRLSPAITFLREWRQFSYPSKILRFSCQNQNKLGKDFVADVELPQFSSVVVPKKGVGMAEAAFSVSSKDFVMNVGGIVSALDWCPRVHSRSDSGISSEFVAVAAHPPESSYHKMGAPVMGRGMVQVWCVLSLNTERPMPAQEQKRQKHRSSNKEGATMKSPEQKKPRGRPRNHPVDVNVNSLVQKKPRGRPRKTALRTSQIVETPALPPLKDSSMSLNIDVGSSENNGHLSEKGPVKVQEMTLQKCNKLEVKARSKIQAENAPTLSNCEENAESPPLDSATPHTMRFDPGPANKYSIPSAVALPRMVLCLAHNGKVAWDVKWRPSGGFDKQRMGYLAVVLGNGALEVWEVPFPHTIKLIYSDSEKDTTTDPRFVKLQPLFRCSRIKCGNRQSIPLSLEWSTTSPHDTILAGCHDGVVALWKFCGNSSSKETKPLLCFSADTVPIRTLSWAPAESTSESSNVIVTGGCKGLKFWDIRDPFRPLWELNPIQRNIYSLDWIPDPRCIIVAFDDGTLRILSLSKGASDVPVTGSPFVGTQQQGFHSYYCSQFPIWSVHTSRLKGMVAYCSSDGTALRFQLTTRAVDRDPRRNRAPHFLCGMLTEEDSALVMFTPLPNIPFPMKHSLNGWAEAPRSRRGFTSSSFQERRADEKMGKVGPYDTQPLALCEGNDSGMELGNNDESAVAERKQATKTKSKSKKKLKDDEQEALVCGDEQEEAPHTGGGVENKATKKFEEFPSMKAAMHRIRWNVNVGSENWLCYGGAAGVVRCQEMNV